MTPHCQWNQVQSLWHGLPNCGVIPTQISPPTSTSGPTHSFSQVPNCWKCWWLTACNEILFLRLHWGNESFLAQSHRSFLVQPVGNEWPIQGYKGLSPFLHLRKTLKSHTRLRTPCGIDGSCIVTALKLSFSYPTPLSYISGVDSKSTLQSIFYMANSITESLSQATQPSMIWPQITCPALCLYLFLLSPYPQHSNHNEARNDVANVAANVSAMNILHVIPFV